MNKTVTQRLLTMPEPCTSQQQGILKLRKIAATPIFQLTPFEQIPDAFLRIELGIRSAYSILLRNSKRKEQTYDYAQTGKARPGIADGSTYHGAA